MSQDQLQALIEAIKNNPQLQQQLSTASSIEEAAGIASEAGFNISSDDINQAIASSGLELTDSELEAVAGGGYGDLIKSLADGGQSCGNAVQELTCNMISVIEKC